MEFTISHRVPIRLAKRVRWSRGALCWPTNVALHVLLHQIIWNWYGMAVIIRKRLFHTIMTIDDYFTQSHSSSFWHHFLMGGEARMHKSIFTLIQHIDYRTLALWPTNSLTAVMLPEGESYQYNGDKMERKPAGIWFESGAVQRAEVTFPSLCPLAISPAQFSVNKELLGSLSIG